MKLFRRRMSEASVQKLKSIAAKVRASEASGTVDNESSKDDISLAETTDTISQSPSKKKVNHLQYIETLIVIFINGFIQ